MSRRANSGRRRRSRRIILCFLISQRTQHLRNQNTYVVVFMYVINEIYWYTWVVGIKTLPVLEHPFYWQLHPHHISILIVYI